MFFSIKKSERMMLFSGCFQSRWHHRTLIVIENGSSFETWWRFLGQNRGGGGSCLPHVGVIKFWGISPYNSALLGLVSYFLAPGSKKSGRKLVYNGWWTHWRSQRHTRALATAATWPVMKQCLGGWEGGDGDWSGPCDDICTWTLYIYIYILTSTHFFSSRKHT